MYRNKKTDKLITDSEYKSVDNKHDYVRHRSYLKGDEDIQLIKEYHNKIKLNGAEEVFKQCSDVLDEKREFFMGFYLNTKNEILAREIISIGTLNECLIHPRETFRSAIVRNSNSIIIAHNHPSGDLEPSPEDIEITKVLTTAGELLGIKLMDHVIVSTKGYNSIKEV